MRVIARYKDNTGKIYAYDIQDKSQTKRVSIADAIKLKDKITNATLLKNGEYRANKGSSIETKVEHRLKVENSVMRINNKETSTSSNNIIINEYYGKDYINICRKIRRYAREGNIKVDHSIHRGNNGKNLHIFKMIEACGISVDNFIKGYLSVLQPYSLSSFPGANGLSKDNMWFCDIGYRVSLLIKVNDRDKNSPIVISFHESNFKSHNKIGGKDFRDKKCAVLINDITSTICNTNEKVVKYYVQRGFIRTEIKSVTNYVNKDVALVEYKDINKEFSTILDKIYARIADMYLDDENDIPTFSIESNQLSFMSHGYSVMNNLSLILDLYTDARDIRTRSALTGITCNLIEELPSDSKKTIKEALISKFGIGYNNKLYDAMIEALV